MSVTNIARAAAILDVEPGASQDEVKSAYRALVRRWHPDRFHGDDAIEREAAGQMARVNWAYEILCERVQDTDSLELTEDVAPFVVPPREAPPFRLTRGQIDDVVRAINEQRSFGREWHGSWSRAAFSWRRLKSYWSRR